MNNTKPGEFEILVLDVLRYSAPELQNQKLVQLGKQADAAIAEIESKTAQQNEIIAHWLKEYRKLYRKVEAHNKAVKQSLSSELGQPLLFEHHLISLGDSDE